MHLVRSLSDYRAASPLALAIGNFDGLHRGHHAVLAQMRDAAQAHGLVPAVLTFEPHPRQFFAPASPAFRLQTRRDKLAGLRDAGTEIVFALRFDAAFAAVSADDFLQRVLGQCLKAKAVITGENFAFGQGRGGGSAQLRAWGAAQGIRILPVPAMEVDGEICSSTAVRRALSDGAMPRVRQLLGRHYSLRGRVRAGEQRGRLLGYPTANILPPPQLKLPRYGVYAVRATVRGVTHDGVANLGVRPTVADAALPQLEVHLFDFAADLYGATMEVAFMAHLRDEKRFDSLAALTQQIADDAHHARRLLHEEFSR